MEIIKIYAQDVPAMRFIGKRYTAEDSDNGSFGKKWGEAFDTGLLDSIEAAEGEDELLYEDADAYIGLMRDCGDNNFEYWIGKFTRPGTPVPEGLGCVDFPKSRLGVGWARGLEQEMYPREDEVIQKIINSGVMPKKDDAGSGWFFERYQCPRFTTPDAEGKVILDICFFAE